MCGITGIFSYTDLNKKWSPEGLEKMIASLSHRGPDGSGSYVEPGIFMGHTRLAVIDLSSAAKQPMTSMNNRFVISFNGEIYNFKKIRCELEKLRYIFRSDSDTEVLLCAWQEWGEDSLKKLDGIFAFAIFDRIKKRLFLVRDHIGVKPLFYQIKDGQVFFASEPHAMFGVLNFYPEVELEDMDTYFTFNYLPAPRTGLKGVYQLQQGHILMVDCNGIKLKNYWKPEYNDFTERWNKKQIDYFAELFATTVKEQMVSDVPLGIFLSGGIDSYAVASAAVFDSSNKPTAFTLGFDERCFDETAASKSYVDYLKIPGENVSFAWNKEEIYKALMAINELLADSSCFPIFQLSRFARQKATVVLAGDGGDELLAGYDTYMASELTPFLRMIPKWIRNVMRNIVKYLPLDNKRYGIRMIAERLLVAANEGRGRDHASFRRIFTDEMKKRLYHTDFLNATSQYDPIGSYAGLIDEVPRTRSYLTARMHADFVFHLPSILAKVDRMSMAHGLEIRVPLLSKKMVEFCINLPDEAKRYKGKGKRILRQIIRTKAPKGTLKRPKAGFLPPVDRWFRYNGPMIEVFKEYLEQARSYKVGLLKWNEVEKLWGEHRSGKIDAGFVLLGILQYINWSIKCKN